MLGTDLPDCLCGASLWDGMGGQFGGLCQSNFKCRDCGRFASHLSDRGGNLLLIVRKPGEGLSERVGAWFDGTIQGVWRDNHQRFEQRVKDACEKLTVTTPPEERNVAALELADLGAGGPLALRAFSLLADPITRGYRGTLVYALLRTVGRWEPDDRPRILTDTPDGKRIIDDPNAPDPMEVLSHLAEGPDYEPRMHARAILDKLRVMESKKERCNYHSGIPDAPIPPRVPGDEIAVWVYRRDGKQWEAVDAEKTQELPVPPDPIRVRHDAYFKEVFEAVGLADTPRIGIANRYYRDTFNREPWYEFALNGFRLTIGPRKRVVSIEIERDQPFDSSPLTKLGERDKVTYDDSPTRSLIHAWDKDKTIEYLRAALQITQEAA